MICPHTHQRQIYPNRDGVVGLLSDTPIPNNETHITLSVNEIVLPDSGVSYVENRQFL